MIRAIVAMDQNRGIANSSGIPWDLPSDRKHFRECTENTTVLMGYNTYKEFKTPLQNRRNYVWCRQGSSLREGFEAVHTLDELVANPSKDLWIIGGAALYDAALAYCSELYITHIAADFDCTKFFPEFHTSFSLVSEKTPTTQNGLTFTHQVWERRPKRV